ncbi:hypothetical protein CS542_08055 [Pedobacter sp. IW39]|nr:hypothetical protein CS542_08055 [Pedobacter sp. IW39]
MIIEEYQDNRPAVAAKGPAIIVISAKMQKDFSIRLESCFWLNVIQTACCMKLPIPCKRQTADGRTSGYHCFRSCRTG